MIRISILPAWAYGVVWVSACLVVGPAVAAFVPEPVVGPVTPVDSVLPATVDATTAQVARILARPLFTPGRRPAPSSALAPPASGPPRLAGIIGTPSHLSAIFETAPPARASVVVTRGAKLDGWIVRSVAPHSVTLERDGEVLVATPMSAATSSSVEIAHDGILQERIADRPPIGWQAGQRRSGPLPSYLQRRP